MHPKEEETSSVKSASCVATTAGPTPAAGEDSARRIVLVCRTLKTRYRSRRAATGSGKHPHQSDSGCARGPSRGNRFANATRYRNGETAQWDGTLAAKPTKAGQARDIGSTPGVARLTSQDEGRRNVPFDGSRAGLQSGEVFTDRVAKRTRCSFGVWAAAEGSASWHIEEARQARQWFDDRKTIHHSHHGGVKPLGARTLGPRKKRDGWRTRKPKKSASVRQRPRRERTRHECS